MELIVVRHGETVENRLNICQGQTDGTLSDHGKEQNRLLAKQLKSKKIDIAYCSPLLRAVETVEQVLEYHDNIIINYDKRLMEWDMGMLQGKEFPVNLDILNNDYSMESKDDVEKRITLFLNYIIKKNAYKSVLIVSHGMTIRIILSILLNIEFENTKVVANSSFQSINI